MRREIGPTREVPVERRGGTEGRREPRRQTAAGPDGAIEARGMGERVGVRDWHGGGAGAADRWRYEAGAVSGTGCAGTATAPAVAASEVNWSTNR